MTDTKISALAITTAFQGDDDVPVSDVTNTSNKRWPVKAIGGLTRRTISAADTLVASDRAKTVEATAGTFSLATTAAATLLDGWWCYVVNTGTGIVTIDPNGAETINGATTLLLSRGDCALVWTDGANFFALGRPYRPEILTLYEIAAPTAPGADQVRIHAFNTGVGAEVRTKDEYGLVDVLNNRDLFRSRKQFFCGLGSDTSAADDSINWGYQFASHEGVWTLSAGAADGQFKNLPTGAVLDADAGLIGGFTMSRRDLNPDVTVKFRVNSTTLRRVWIGWMEADHMGSDSTAATHKFALRLSTSPAVTGFTIVHSNGTTETVEAQIIASDTAIHTIRLLADNANSRWGYSFDGATVVWISANIPAAADLVGLQMEIRTLEAVAKNMDFWWLHGSADK